MDCAKYRIRFCKGGDLRLLSHHDLMRTFERMLRRAALPFRNTEGFHPKPRMVFALSLPLGVVGLQEVVELELTEALPPEEVLARIQAQAPAGLDFLSIKSIPARTTGQVIRAVYRCRIPIERHADLTRECARVLAQPECLVPRLRPEPRTIDIRPYLLDLHLVGDSLEIAIRVTPTGAARADEIMTVLGLSDLLEAGAVLERTELDIRDETLLDLCPPACPSELATLPVGAPAQTCNP